jgi:hypothetical protein
MKKSMLAVLAALAAIGLTGITTCLVPDNAYLMNLNRNGKWREAERTGLAMIAGRNPLTPNLALGRFHETYLHVIYAETRLGKADEAAALLEKYEGLAADDPLPLDLLWVPRELTKLKDELGLLSSAQKTIVRAMEENEKKNYPLAAELCAQAIRDPSAGDVQKATAHLIAAICFIRQGNAGEAEAQLAAYDGYRSALPAAHQALRDEAFARRGLDELKTAQGGR